LWPEFNKHAQEVHDKKIYEDELKWHYAGGPVYANYTIDGTVYPVHKVNINWRTDEHGRRFIFETDLLIKWEPDEK
jgi:hypothetical protein